MLQREQADAAADVMKHAEGTKEFFESQEKLADKALQVLTKMAEIEADQLKLLDPAPARGDTTVPPPAARPGRPAHNTMHNTV
jgi:hypothetical protein